ncbi:hypothetical protein [Streptomyces nojiriensis]|uniref:hypothetical protein n=1 Tax=Streptomyces nojiriensis TaxID=66374 RepID=UPI0035DDBA23
MEQVGAAWEEVGLRKAEIELIAPAAVVALTGPVYDAVDEYTTLALLRAPAFRALKALAGVAAGTAEYSIAHQAYSAVEELRRSCVDELAEENERNGCRQNAYELLARVDWLTQDQRDQILADAELPAVRAEQEQLLNAHSAAVLALAEATREVLRADDVSALPAVVPAARSWWRRTGD